MKCKKTEYGIELIPETDFERDCLRHVQEQVNVTLQFEDAWNRTGNLKIEGQPHHWDKT